MIIIMMIINRSSNPAQKSRPSDNYQKRKENRRRVCYAVLADRKVKINEAKKSDKYLDLARELKKLRNM